MSPFEQIILTIITSTTTAAIIGFLGKSIIERYVDYLFKKKEALQDNILQAAVNANEALFDKELTVFPEVVEVVYRCRNLARDCLTDETRNIKVIRDFSEYAVHLSENLYKYRLFLSDESFRKLHRYKGEIQEFLILLNEITRSHFVEDSPVNLTVQEFAKSQMQEKYQIINRLSEELITETQSAVRYKTTITK